MGWGYSVSFSPRITGAESHIITDSTLFCQGNHGSTTMNHGVKDTGNVDQPAGFSHYK